MCFNILELRLKREKLIQKQPLKNVTIIILLTYFE